MTKLDWQRAKARNQAGLAALDGPPSNQQVRRLALRGMPKWAQLTPPSCPACRRPMVIRFVKTTGTRFWGCANYPRCKHTENIVVKGR